MKGKVITHRLARLKLFAALLVCALFLFAPVSAKADGEAPAPLDLTTPCTVTLAPAGSEDAAFTEDIAAAGTVVKVDLYLVADAVASTEYDTYTFSLAAPFDTLSLSDNPTPAEWRTLANEAGEIIYNNPSLVPAVSGKAGETLTLPAPGLYAVIAHGDLNPYVKTVGEGTEARRMSFVRGALFDYLYQPELIALPTKSPDASGVVSTANAGEWLYNLSAALKPERERRLGSLEVVKTLLQYDTTSAATFVFEVKIELDGATLSRKVYSLSFSDAGKKSFRLDELPAGAVVTVTEVYSGAAYTLVTANDQTATIEADTVKSVGFTNDYTETHRTGGSIENRFTMGSDGWEWSQHSDSTDR